MTMEKIWSKWCYIYLHRIVYSSCKISHMRHTMTILPSYLIFLEVETIIYNTLELKKRTKCNECERGNIFKSFPSKVLMLHTYWWNNNFWDLHRCALCSNLNWNWKSKDQSNDNWRTTISRYVHFAIAKDIKMYCFFFLFF